MKTRFYSTFVYAVFIKNVTKNNPARKIKRCLSEQLFGLNPESITIPVMRITDLIKESPALILDGGLATELEKRGRDLNNPLWSARLIETDPAAIKDVHISYLKAGADIITTASYQASYRGCLAVGMSEAETTEMFRAAVSIAVEAREEFLGSWPNGAEGKSRHTPLIAASIGPYGAFLADGSEYRGAYGISKNSLYDFHKKRWNVLAESEADVIACETIPSFDEAEVLLDIIDQTPNRDAYFSFSCIDEKRISDGTPIRKCAALLAASEKVVAIGVNCTSPIYISGLISEIRAGAPGKPVVVYPNSGEKYDGTAKSWSVNKWPGDFVRLVPEWRRLGANIIGGCCRTGPEDIMEIVKVVKT